MQSTRLLTEQKYINQKRIQYICNAMWNRVRQKLTATEFSLKVYTHTHSWGNTWYISWLYTGAPLGYKAPLPGMLSAAPTLGSDDDRTSRVPAGGAGGRPTLYGDRMTSASSSLQSPWPVASLSLSGDEIKLSRRVIGNRTSSFEDSGYERNTSHAIDIREINRASFLPRNYHSTEILNRLRKIGED